MKSLKIIWLLLFIIFLTGGIHAQINPVKQPLSKSPQIEEKYPESPAPDISVAGILRHTTTPGERGGMYMDPEWENGTLVLTDGTTIENWKYRYNIRFDQMQYFNGTDTLAFANPVEIKSLRMENGKTFVVTDFRHLESVDTGYFELIRDGRNKLLYRRVITAHIEEQDKDTDDDFLHNDIWYVKFGNEPAKPVFLNKKCMMNIFGEKSDKIKTFVKEKHIKCKSKEDLIAVFEYYNSLES